MFFVKVNNKTRSYRLGFRQWVSTKYMYLFCFFYKVPIGTGCRFWKRTTIYKEVGAQISIGNNCLFRSDTDSNLIGVSRHCIISAHSPSAIIRIGNGCAFSGNSIGAKSSIEIGENVMVGANSIITDFDWHSLDPLRRDDASRIKSKKVVIGNNVWIGADCKILKGVHIGENAVVGAGSVVVSDIPANSICAGNPCKPIRKLEAAEYSNGGLAEMTA